MRPEQILEQLDPEQRQVAESIGGPLCVLAGAGTGKTRAITHRIAYAVATGKYNPRHVLAVTFTSKAAAEMRSRLRDLGTPAVQARTFHSAALRQLRYFWPRTIGGPMPELVPNKIGMVASACHQLNMKVDRAALRDITSELEWAKVSLILPEQYPVAAARLGREGVSGFDARSIARIMARYEDVKSDNNVIDFDDVLLLTASLLDDYPQMAREVRGQYRHFVVDEFQDVSALQHRLLRAWLGHSQDVCVVGDAAQTIYTFAGAQSTYLTEFTKEFPRASVVKLERNYRSTPEIVKAANGVLDAAASRRDDTRLTLRAQRDSGPQPLVIGYDDDVKEADGVADSIGQLINAGTPASDIAILFRTNAQSENFEQALGVKNIPYLVKGGEKFFERQDVRSAMVTLRAAVAAAPPGHNPAQVAMDVLSGQGWTTTPPEGTGAIRERWDALNAIVNVAKNIGEREGSTIQDVVAELQERAEAQSAPTVEGVTLASIHTAKGLEWPVVYVVGASRGLIPISMAKTDEAIEEERRLFYVALTRARDILTVTWSAARSEGARASRKASPFIQGAFDRSRDRTDRSAVSRSTGRRGATIFLHCSQCSGALETAAEQKIGRHRDCGGEQSAELFNALREWRLDVSRELKRPAFAVFTNDTLLAIADRAPRDEAQLLAIPGMGPVKREQYGEAVLAIVNRVLGSEKQ
ncbi:ATP-dependent DNA helicase UvrD2 [Helcobacillus massiliensis]|uniref:ATP-dependent DNA helicase UvrD2 n=1 Tax=Helcobacillus massiliensis TaxID=521392 RepID=UPI002554B7EF|nr:ATP-dependent DNA helicase UvrD2 [Helcobacillus massiliensis]MDK7741800.1 ATP-dependent DNA helicase UvrD2 [Helcobacillus massiliensis]WOO92105.1 ATP-dependent DNA helicase UvrD2 [Helcobacillus massiliensis]